MSQERQRSEVTSAIVTTERLQLMCRHAAHQRLSY